MIDFSDTSESLSHKSQKELNREYFLLKLLQFPVLLIFGKSVLNLTKFFKLPLKGILRQTIFGKFCGGESINDSLSVIKDLKYQGISTVLDYAVEAKTKENEFDKVMEEILRAVAFAAKEPSISFCVFKISAITGPDVLERMSRAFDHTHDEEWLKLKSRIFRICGSAMVHNVRIFIDAEESWIQPAIDLLAEEAMETFNQKKAVVFHTIQLYRKDKLEYLKKLVKHAREHDYYPGFKLVRGAYLEKENHRAIEKGYTSPIHISKENTDKDYNDAISFCVENHNIVSFCIGTHNEESINELVFLMNQHKIHKGNPQIFCIQLYGMGDHITYKMASLGYNASKYLPYGPILEVIPYLIRRAEENSSTQGQTSRELLLVKAELERRKKKS